MDRDEHIFGYDHANPLGKCPSAEPLGILRRWNIKIFREICWNSCITKEIETPIDKEDLVRFEDNYGRQEKPYEGKKFFTDLSKDEILLKDPGTSSQKYEFRDSILKFERHYNCDELINKSDDTIFAIIKGGLFSDNSQIVLSPGEVVRTETIKKLSEVFKIKDYIDVIVINKNEK